MGYDMFIEVVSDDEAAKVRAAEDAFHAAARSRDALNLPPGHSDFVEAQEEVERTYKVLRDADSSYFRLNIWGMSRYCEVMDQLGMVVSGYELPPFPHQPDGVTREEIDAFGDRVPGRARPSGRRWRPIGNNCWRTCPGTSSLPSGSHCTSSVRTTGG